MYWLAFTTGILGSLHCVGMCGPIALALPIDANNKWTLLRNASLYNIGRTLTYVFLGLLVGLFGEGFQMAGFQKGLSILLGVLLLLAVAFSINMEKQLVQIPLISRLYFQLKIQLAKFLKHPSPLAIFFTGLLNGLLPCGLVYVALAGALSTNNLAASMLYMLYFGIGTVPLLLLTILMGHQTTLPIKSILQRSYPVFLSILGIWLIYRGVEIYLPDKVYLQEILSTLPMCY